MPFTTRISKKPVVFFRSPISWSSASSPAKKGEDVPWDVEDHHWYKIRHTDGVMPKTVLLWPVKKCCFCAMAYFPICCCCYIKQPERSAQFLFSYVWRFSPLHLHRHFRISPPCRLLPPVVKNWRCLDTRYFVLHGVHADPEFLANYVTPRSPDSFAPLLLRWFVSSLLDVTGTTLNKKINRQTRLILLQVMTNSVTTRSRSVSLPL